MEMYHVFTKSIAGYKIICNNDDSLRIKELMMYFKYDKTPMSFSHFLRYKRRAERLNKPCPLSPRLDSSKEIVRIVAYCLMPTHVHMVIEQLEENGMPAFMSNILNSYTRYFNTKTNRKGPLWESRFGRVKVDSDEQLMHLTRFIHLNPVTAHLVDNPADWAGSSYHEYLGKDENKICKYDDLLEIIPAEYEKFVSDNIDYQRELAVLRDIVLEKI